MVFTSPRRRSQSYSKSGPPHARRYTCSYPQNCRGGEYYNNTCFEGQAAIDACSVDLCAATSTGPLCGKCKWAQQPRSYMKEEKCLRCQGGETALVVSVLVLLVAAPTVGALVLWRFTRARALTLRIYRRVFDIGRFKVTPPSEWHQLKNKNKNKIVQLRVTTYVMYVHFTRVLTLLCMRS